jgi:hypothetical protein
MEDKSYEVDKMLNTLIDLAGTEVEKAKQRGYFGKDFVEAATMVIGLANDKYSGGMGRGGYGTYGNRRNDYPGYGNYRGYGDGRSGYGENHGGYGENEGYPEDGTGEYGRGRKGYGRSGERYG